MKKISNFLLDLQTHGRFRDRKRRDRNDGNRENSQKSDANRNTSLSELSEVVRTLSDSQTVLDPESEQIITEVEVNSDGFVNLKVFAAFLGSNDVTTIRKASEKKPGDTQ